MFEAVEQRCLVGGQLADLACAAVTKTVGTIGHRAARTVETRIVVLLAAGNVAAAIGVAVALTSLGAGAIGAACLALSYPELEPAHIAGSDLAHAVPLTAVATLGHAWLGTIDGTLLLVLLCIGLRGIVLGSLAPRHVPIRTLRLMLMATLAPAGVKLIA